MPIIDNSEQLQEFLVQIIIQCERDRVYMHMKRIFNQLCTCNCSESKVMRLVKTEDVTEIKKNIAIKFMTD